MNICNFLLILFYWFVQNLDHFKYGSVFGFKRLIQFHYAISEYNLVTN